MAMFKIFFSVCFLSTQLELREGSSANLENAGKRWVAGSFGVVVWMILEWFCLELLVHCRVNILEISGEYVTQAQV